MASRSQTDHIDFVTPTSGESSVQHLSLTHLKVDTLLLHQLNMTSHLCDLPTLEDEDAVRVLDSAQPMYNGDGRPHPVPSSLVERRLHQPLPLRVQRACRLVKEQDLRVSDQRPGDSHTLSLAAGEPSPAGANIGPQPFW